MANRPILFSAPMVRALLEGRKTQTRRVLKTEGVEYFLRDSYGSRWVAKYVPGEKPEHSFTPGAARPDLAFRHRLPHAVGDRLWVREAWRADDYDPTNPERTIYRADAAADALAETKGIIRWKPGIHLPRDRSRLTLIVTDVRVQRLQEITTADALLEGVDIGLTGGKITRPNTRESFRQLWDSLNEKRGFGWGGNPWVAAISFTVERRIIDGEPA